MIKVRVADDEGFNEAGANRWDVSDPTPPTQHARACAHIDVAGSFVER